MIAGHRKGSKGVVNTTDTKRTHSGPKQLRTGRKVSGPSTDRRALVVLGMHRSGTSAVTRVCNLLGMDLGSKLLSPNSDNEEGFWELEDIYSAHEKLLADIGSAWDDYRALPETWLDHPAAGRFRRRAVSILKDEFSESRFWGVKDPRICRLVPIWLSILGRLKCRAHFVLVGRSPLELAGSLARRDSFPLAKSQYLWLRHLIEAERDTRGHPRAFVTFEGLLKDWQQTMSNVSEKLDITWPRPIAKAAPEIDRFLKVQRRHQAVSDLAVDTDHRLSRWIREAYRAFRAATDDDTQLRRVLTEIEKEVEAAAPVLEPWARELEADLARNRDETKTLRGEFTKKITQAEQQIGELDAKIKARYDDIAWLNKQLSDRQIQIDDLRQELNDAKANIAERQKDIAWLDTEMSIQAGRLEKQGDELEAAAARATEQDQETGRLGSELSARLGEIEQLRDELEAAKGRAAEQGQEIGRLNSEVSARLGEIEQLKAALEAASGRSLELDEEVGRLKSEVSTRRGETGQLRAELDAARARSAEQHNTAGRSDDEHSAQQHEIENLKGELQAARARIAARDERIETLTQSLAKARAVSEHAGGPTAAPPGKEVAGDDETATRRLRDQDWILESLRRKNNELLKEREAILRSTSWRLTRPLRGAKQVALWLGHSRDDTPAPEQQHRPKTPASEGSGPEFRDGRNQQVPVDTQAGPRDGGSDSGGASEERARPPVGATAESRSVFLVERAVQTAREARSRRDRHGDAQTVSAGDVLSETWGRELNLEATKAKFDARARAALQEFIDRGDRLSLPAAAPPKVSLPRRLLPRLFGRTPPAARPKVSIVLVLYDRAELTYLCLESIKHTLDLPVETVIVDNASSDATETLLGRLDGAKVIRNHENVGFLRAVNQALRAATGDYVLLLNNDALLFPGAVAAAVGTIESEADIGAVGGRIVLPDGRLQEAGSIVWNDGSCLGYGRGAPPDDPAYLYRRDVDYCSGAFLLVRRDLFVEMGGFDETLAPAYYEETDLCLRLHEKGYRTVYEPNAIVLHYEFASSASQDRAIELQKANQKKFAAKHEKALIHHCPPGPHNVLVARSSERGKPRLLVLDDQVPRRGLGSGFPRANDIVHELVALGYIVTIYPMTMPEEDLAELYSELPREVEILCGKGSGKLEGFLKDRPRHYDTILVSRPHNMETFNAVYESNKELFEGVRIIYDAEAIFALRDVLKQKLGGVESPREMVDDLVKAEIDLGRCADRIVTVSQPEAAEFTKRGFPEVFVLGHKVAPQPTPAAFEQRHGILFVGAMHGDDTPNADSVLWFAEAVWPALSKELPEDAGFVIAGTNKSQAVCRLYDGRIRVCGFVDDLRALYDSCRLFIAPTRYAAGIPYKAHEAAAHGLPMVTTSLIAGQLGWRDGEDLLVADTPEDFTRQCLAVYRDKDIWQRVRQSALQRVKTETSPESFRANLAAVLTESEPAKAALGGI